MSIARDRHYARAAGHRWAKGNKAVWLVGCGIIYRDWWSAACRECGKHNCKIEEHRLPF